MAVRKKGKKVPQLPTGFGRYLVGNYAPAAPPLVYGKGASLYDREGNDYIDLAAGIAVSSLGHNHPGLVRAVSKQAQRLIHVSNHFAHDLTAKVARQLVTATGMEQVFFCNSGAEANECALKLARKRGVALRPDKYQVVSLIGSFHGRIGLALAASGQPRLWEAFGPQPPGFVHAEATEHDLRQAVTAATCAVIVEPIQGEGGLRVIAPEILTLLHQLCQEHDALLILDEVQTGVGRTGRILASERSLQPDIVTLAKGLGGGVPVGAMLVAHQAVGVLQVGDHGTTFGANALALAAVEEVLNQVTELKFLNIVRKRAKQLRARLEQMRAAGAPIVELRGRGLMCGVQLDAQKLSAQEAKLAAMAAGVLVVPAGDNVIRTMPPLNISEREIETGCNRLATALS